MLYDIPFNLGSQKKTKIFAALSVNNLFTLKTNTY